MALDIEPPATAALRSVADPLGSVGRRHRGRHPRAGQPEHGRRVADARRRAGRRPARRHACWRSAAPVRCTRAASPSCSSRRASSSPSTPACCRRSARWSRRCASTWRAAWCGRCSRSTWTSATRCSTELRDEGRRVLAAAGVAADGIRFRYGVDARYLGQGNEITIWVGEGRRSVAGHLRRRSCELFEADYRRIYGLTIPDVGVEAVTWRLSAFAAAATGRAAGRRWRPTIGDVLTHAPGALQPRRRARRHAGVPPARPRPRPADRRPGHRRGARDHRGHPPGWMASVAADGSLVADEHRSNGQ